MASDAPPAEATPATHYDLNIHDGEVATVLGFRDHGIELAGDRIGWSIDGQRQEASLADIAVIRLTTEIETLQGPMGSTTCQIRFQSDQAVTVFGGNSRSPDAADRRARYEAFVADLHRRLGPGERARIRFIAGFGGARFGMLLVAAVIFTVFLIVALLALLFGGKGPRILPGLATAAGAVMTIGLFRLLQRNAPHSYDPAAPLGSATAGSIGEAIGDLRPGTTFGKWLVAGAIAAALVAIVALPTLLGRPTPAPVSAVTASQAVKADNSIDPSELKTLHDQASALEAPIAEFHDNSGHDFEEKGLYDQAIAEYAQAIALKPDFALAYFDRGYAFEKKELYDQAIADFTQALSLDPKDGDSYYDRGIAFDGKSLHDQAIADFTQAIALEPDFEKAYFHRGYDSEEKGLHDQAIADLTQAISLDPNNGDRYYVRGVAFEGKGLRDKAIADFRAALARDPKSNDAKAGLVDLGATP